MTNCKRGFSCPLQGDKICPLCLEGNILNMISKEEFDILRGVKKPTSETKAIKFIGGNVPRAIYVTKNLIEYRIFHVDGLGFSGPLFPNTEDMIGLLRKEYKDPQNLVGATAPTSSSVTRTKEEDMIDIMSILLGENPEEKPEIVIPNYGHETQKLIVMNDRLHTYQEKTRENEEHKIFDLFVFNEKRLKIKVEFGSRPVALKPNFPTSEIFLTREAEQRLKEFYVRSSDIGRFWRRLTDIRQKDTKVKTRTLKSVMKNKAINEAVRTLLINSERCLSGNEEDDPRTVKLMANDNVAWNVLGSQGSKETIRSVSGLSMRIGLNRHVPLFDCKSPVERDIKEPEDREPMSLAHYVESDFSMTGYEIAGWMNYAGPAYDALIYGGHEIKGATARASATRASEELLRGVGVEDFVLVDLSNPNSIPEDCFEDRNEFLAPYVMGAHHNGDMELIINKGIIDYEASWDTGTKGMSPREVKDLLGIQFKNDFESYEIDGEILLTEESANQYDIYQGGLQFRATEQLTDWTVDHLNRLAIMWQEKPLSGDHVNMIVNRVDMMCERAVSHSGPRIVSKGNACPIPGIYKGAAFPRASLKKNLMDVNTVKGRNKGILKDMLRNGEHVSLRCSFGVMSGQELEGKVSNSWQTYFLLLKGSLEPYVKNLIKIIKESMNLLINEGILVKWLRNYLVDGAFIDIETDQIIEGGVVEEDTLDENDPLHIIIKNWDFLREKMPNVNWVHHHEIAKRLYKAMLRLILKSIFGWMPKGQTKEHFEEDQPRASISYLWSAPDLPSHGTIRIHEEGKEVVKIAATCAYHHDKRYWNKTGLIWRYPIFKDTTIIPCIYLEPPSYYDLEEGKPSMLGMAAAAIKVLLFGDTDGDKVCFSRFWLDGDDTFSIKYTRKGFIVDITRTPNKPEHDDYALLRAYGSIKSGGVVRPLQFDPCEVLDKGPDAKKLLDIPWRNILIPWVRGEDSRKIMGPVALMVQAATRLEGEVQVLESLLNDPEGYLYREDGKNVSIFLDKPLSTEEKRQIKKLLGKSRSIVDSLYKWGPLEGESAVCGAKYDTSGGLLRALKEILKDNEFAANIYCDGCKLDRDFNTKKCHKCKVHKFVIMSQAEKLDLDMVNSAGDVFTILLEAARVQLEEARKIMEKKDWNGKNIRKWKQGEKHSQPALRLKEKQTFKQPSWSLDYNVRYDGIRMSSKPDSNLIASLSGERLNKALTTLVREPDFLCDITSRMVSCVREDIIEYARSFNTWKTSKRFGRNNQTKARAFWSKLVASVKEDGSLKRVSDLNLNEDQITKIENFLEANELLHTFTIRIKNYSYEFMRDPNKDRKFSYQEWSEQEQKIRYILSKCGTYGDLRFLAAIINFLTCGKWDENPFPSNAKEMEGLIERNFLYMEKEGVWDLIKDIFEVKEWNDLKDILMRPKSPKAMGELSKFLSQKERELSKEIRFNLETKLAEWSYLSAREEVEYLWRIAHGIKLENRFKYRFGIGLAINVLFMNLDKFKETFGLNVKVKNNEIIGPLPVSFNVHGVIPKEGDVISLQIKRAKSGMQLYPHIYYKEHDGFIWKSDSRSKRPPLRSLFPSYVPLDTVWDEPKVYKILKAEPDTYVRDVKRKGELVHSKGDRVPWGNYEFWAITLIAIN